MEGWLADPPSQVWVGEGGARRLGAWVRLVVLERDGLVREARVQVYGCPHTVAASRHVARQLAGRRLGGEAAATGLQPGLPEQWLQAVNGPVEKLGRMLHIEDAIRSLQVTPWPSR
jgi:hypothetical protein